MRKNGFTLIELLAVIVILAIIALIATPIILGIINDARKESQERSVELYASAVRNGIAAYQLREMKEVAAGTYTSETLPFDVEADGDVVCTTIDIYEDGGVYVAGCTVNGVAVEYTYGEPQVAKGTMAICDPVSVQTEGAYTAGDKYTCEVADGVTQTFYVLTTPASGAESVNLIMDSNINSSGTAVKEGVSDKGLVAWYADEYNNSYGPITAMTYLQTATSSWTNVNAQTISTFTDDAGETHEMATTFTTNARLPYYSEISDVSSSKLYLIDYLYDAGYQTNVVNDVYGYWTLSSDASFSDYAWYVDYCGYAYNDYVSYGGFYGVRPVINLSI